MDIYYSFRIQCRVVSALLLRETITRYGRHGLGMLWLFLEPMMFTLGVATLWYFSKLHIVSNIPIFAFAVTGYSSVLLWRNAANRCSKAIEPNLSLMYHRNVKVIDIFFSRLILEILGASGSFIMLSVVFSNLGLMNWPIDLFSVLSGWLMLSWYAIALGLIVGVFSERSETFERVWHVLTYLLFPMSGAAFMVAWMPFEVRKWILILPMVHGVEWIRHGFFGEMVVTYEDFYYFFSVNLALTFCGLVLVRSVSEQIQPE